MGIVEWPDLCPGRIWWPDKDHGRQKNPPDGIVIHSGDKAPRVAEAAQEMDISYHFAHATRFGCIVQLVKMNRRAYHAGPEGNDWLGIALSGPDEQRYRPLTEKNDFRLLLEQLQDVWAGTLKYWCRHSDITEGKHDPGPGFDETWVDGFGLTWKKGPR